MLTRSVALHLSFWLIAALVLPVAAAAQDVPAAQLPLPTPTATPAPVPSPVVTPTPIATPAAEAVIAPRPRPTASRPVSTAIPAPRSTPSAVAPAPMAAATPVPRPQASLTPEPIETVVLPQQRDGTPLWPWLAGVGAAGVALLALAWARHRRREDRVAEEPWEEPPAAPPMPEPRPTLQPGRVALALRPLRAGLNLISATAECEVTVVNTGDLPVEEVRVALELMSAREGQGDGLAAFFAAPIVRPAIPAFALAPGEGRRFRTVTALAHEAIHALDAGGRPMFVPLLALSAHYVSGGAARRIGQAFAVGVERVDSAKLGPFWLDTPPRLYDAVAARAHGGQVEA